MDTGGPPALVKDVAPTPAPGDVPRRHHPAALRVHGRDPRKVHGSPPCGVFDAALG